MTLITESGQVQDLTLTPADKGSATVILKGQKKNDAAAPTKTEASTQYLEATLPVQEKMIRAMKMLVAGQFQEMEAEAMDRKEIDGLSFSHKKSYQVGPYKGHQYELHNTTETLFDVDETALYQMGDLALSVGQKVLKPQGYTIVWVIQR
ncbi:MAG: type-F conjugative transfer system secretin TraK [Candidatus Paracaedibacteraceae bacterium]|nr:type-F conjugative transfer system secretin TraK [Candidatus Paracaedibacteraceae bacterium]